MFRSLCDDVLDIIWQWIPKKKYSEKPHDKYRDDLMVFIRSELKRGQQNILFGTPKKHRIKKETGKAYADIEIDRNIGIELKLNLKGKSKISGLTGQIDYYEEEYNCIIIVLCGEVSEETVEEVEYKIKRKYGSAGFGLGSQGPRVEVVRKDEASLERRKKGKETSGGYNAEELIKKAFG